MNTLLRRGQSAKDGHAAIAAAKQCGVATGALRCPAHLLRRRQRQLQPAQRAVPLDQRGAQALWRVSVPDTTAPLSLGPTLVEWHGALRWLRLPLAAAQQVRSTAQRAGGHATLFRGGDRQAPVFGALTPTQQRIHAELKRAFDPAGILNPGRLMPDF